MTVLDLMCIIGSFGWVITSVALVIIGAVCRTKRIHLGVTLLCGILFLATVSGHFGLALGAKVCEAGS